MKRFKADKVDLATIHPLLADIVYNRRVYLPDGRTEELRAEVSRQEMAFIQTQIAGLDICRNVLEIGMAMGISALVIEAALDARGGGVHLIIDPYQSTQWRGIGVEHLRRAGFTRWVLVESGSEIALPRLVEQSREFDLIFQDGMHTFDHCMLEFHYLDRLLRPGGLLLYDDIDCYHLNRLIRYVSLYPHWEIAACAGSPCWSRGRKAFDAICRFAAPVLSLFPRQWAIEVFSDALLRPNRRLGLDSSMIALRKTGNDTRGFSYKEKF